VDLHERAGVRARRRTLRIPEGKDTLREGAEKATPSAELHVDDEPGARGDLRDEGRLRVERHHLADLG
jgi:hypothetical protein